MADTVAVAAGILGLFSVLLGFAAEAKRIHLSDIYYVPYLGCVHPESPAFGLAVVAVLLLLIMQILLSCCGCCEPAKDLPPAPNVLPSQAGNKPTSAIIMILASWVTFVISFTLFLKGAMANTRGGQIDDNCSTVGTGIFATASILALITVGLGIGAYNLFRDSYDAGITSSNPAIAMSTPQPNPQGLGQAQFQQPGCAQGTPQPGAQPGWQGPAHQGTTQTQQQNYYPPPGTMPTGYGYNTQTNM